MVFKSNTERNAAIVIAKRLFADGKSVKEVASMMCLSESKVRTLKRLIDETQNDK